MLCHLQRNSKIVTEKQSESIAHLFWFQTKSHTDIQCGDILTGSVLPPSSWWTWASDTRWRHQMEIFSALLAICAGNSPVIGEFPAQRPVTRSFDVFSGLRLQGRLSKQWRGWWFETQSCSLGRHCHVYTLIDCLGQLLQCCAQYHIDGWV